MGKFPHEGGFEGVVMTVLEAIKTRKSVRAFLDKEVPQTLIEEILQIARFAPSSTNTQPWEICVVRAERKKLLENKMLKAFKSGDKGGMDYKYSPDLLPKPMREKQVSLGKKMYGLLGITKDDKEKSIKQWSRNYISFDAPVVIYLFMDKTLEKGSFFDCGMFMQTLALVASEKGLSTCMQASLAQYPNIVRDELKIDDSKILLCGISLGYEDKQALINSFKSDRMEVEEFTTFYS